MRKKCRRCDTRHTGRVMSVRPAGRRSARRDKAGPEGPAKSQPPLEGQAPATAVTVSSTRRSALSTDPVRRLATFRPGRDTPFMFR